MSKILARSLLATTFGACAVLGVPTAVSAAPEPAAAAVDESPLTKTSMPRSAATTCDNSAGTGHCVTTAPIEDGIIPCPAGWICLYTASGWREMQVRWPAGNYHPNFALIDCPSGVKCNHGGRGFNDEVSSWANNGTGILYCVNWDAAAGSLNNDMPSGTQGSYIGDLWNDQSSALSSSGC
ncbi:hypothetical protein [Umezawaea tangerina]|uniref:Peptidase inhibitor family I36 n=1 Tax=Umezawaea tangerina TaxID=84725 RepID=A0A2T0T6Q1_9PSEU|nr:hypothetical protein [Umezawaea tangerina]PRY41356.1 hypothetical protein CLV43_105114 [Umezawaea tangerina]